MQTPTPIIIDTYKLLTVEEALAEFIEDPFEEWLGEVITT